VAVALAGPAHGPHAVDHCRLDLDESIGPDLAAWATVLHPWTASMASLDGVRPRPPYASPTATPRRGAKALAVLEALLWAFTHHRLAASSFRCDRRPKMRAVHVLGVVSHAFATGAARLKLSIDRRRRGYARSDSWSTLHNLLPLSRTGRQSLEETWSSAFASTKSAIRFASFKSRTGTGSGGRLSSLATAMMSEPSRHIRSWPSLGR
jgi:hypothetical protein